jgi:hypothetical protein
VRASLTRSHEYPMAPTVFSSRGFTGENSARQVGRLRRAAPKGRENCVDGELSEKSDMGRYVGKIQGISIATIAAVIARVTAIWSRRLSMMRDTEAWIRVR